MDPASPPQTSQDTIPISSMAIAPTFKEMIYLRFGCTLIEEYVPSVPHDPLPSAVVAKKLLGNSEIEATESEMEQFCLFLAYLTRARSLNQIPSGLFDFHQPESKLHSDWMVHVRRAPLNREMHYIITETETQPQAGRDLCIVLKSATTALEIVRQGWGPRLRDVMEYLLARGIHFMACSRSDSEQPPQDTAGPVKRARHYSGLGFRPPKYKPSLADYRAYVSLRRAFLRGPRGRAALLYGGVVGRLARSDGVDVDQVFRGPSADVHRPENGICLWDERAATAYWDDRLSDHEIDLICGVYHVATGQTDEHGAQTTILSWWPRPEAVLASGNNVGWWTPMWEFFYHKRLQQLESGNGILANHTKWKHNLQLEKEAPQYTTANETCSAHILACLRP